MKQNSKVIKYFCIQKEYSVPVQLELTEEQYKNKKTFIKLDRFF